MTKKPKKQIFMDYGILIPYILLSIIGIVMVYSATAYRLIMNDVNEFRGGMFQALYFIMGLVIVLIIYQMKTSFLQKKGLSSSALIIMIVLLLGTLVIGVALGGAKGWIDIGPVRLQPIEFLKIIIIWYMASFLSRRQNVISNNFLSTVIPPLVGVGVAIFLVLIQPDTGGAAILVLITLVMLLASGISYWYGIVISLGGVAVSWLAIEFVLHIGKFFIPNYIVKRFEVFRDPFVDQYHYGQQLIQSYYAMFNGGLFGLGLGNSIQKKGFLPVAESDFIFSIVIEELGLIVAIAILLLLLFLILRIFMVGIKATSTFNSLMCIGIGAMLLIQTFINVGGITGIIPLTGVTFPFISQGGSSLLALSIGIGLVLNIRADELRKQYHKQLETIVPHEEPIQNKQTTREF